MKTIIVSCLIVFASFSCFSADKTQVPADRWMEIDLFWFNRDNIQGSVDEFWERYYPLFECVDGWKGVIINVGWVMDYILEWKGDLNQQILLPKNMKQEGTFNEQGYFRGNSVERFALWKNRFPDKNGVFTPVNYQPWSYGDLKKLALTLRKVAFRKYYLSDFKVGTFAVGWDATYGGEISNFAKVHSNLFLKDVYYWNKVVNLEATLNVDSCRYATFPNGIPQGTPFTVFFGKQWGSLSEKVGLDAILLRDSFLGSGVYGRTGLYGKIAPADPLKVDLWTKAAADLVKQTKTANPKCIVIGYSNGASGVADWRVNCLDLETIANEGYLDAWIDQTWAGAWNEVGQRPYNFWNTQNLGWTYQLAYILTRAAALANSKVRHYFLTETFDAWELWDIIHNAPDRLRWGIWAYSHASVKTPFGLKIPKGNYISWGNQGKSLLTKEDVKFLSVNINEAMIDAHQMTEISGPTLVYNRNAMEWQSKNAPDLNIKEWIDEQAGTIIKWSVPILSVTRMEYLPKVESDLFIFQTPVHLPVKDKETILNLINSGKPVAVFGSPAGGIDPEIAESIGISTKETTVKNIKYIGSLHSRTDGFFEGLPNTFPLYQPFTRTTNAKDTNVIYSVDRSPCLILNSSGHKRVMFWDPPELSVNVNAYIPQEGTSLDEMLGSPVPWVLTARVLNSLAKNSGQPYVEKIEEYNPASLSIWKRSDGSYRILAGNLEEGINHKADQSRKLILNFPESWSNNKIIQSDEIWHGGKQITNNKLYIFMDQEKSKLYTISSKK
jgi:hypothetical protein